MILMSEIDLSIFDLRCKIHLELINNKIADSHIYLIFYFVFFFAQEKLAERKKILLKAAQR